MKDIQEAILESINYMLQEKLKKVKYNYCLEGVITAVEDDIYTLKIDDQETTCKSINGAIYQVNDIVYILVINNEMSNKIILGKRT